MNQIILLCFSFFCVVLPIVNATECGIMECPNSLTGDDSYFCCSSESGLGVDVEYCCNLGDWLRNNPGIIAGIAIGAIVIVALAIICCLCCCCASCCASFKAGRRGHNMS